LIWIEKDDRKINAKSLLGVLSLGIAKGMTVTIIADGQDENDAITGLSDLINTGFAEFE
jgi:phosphocarrier protein